jgi:metal-responsive CopG/Arc/MetJ family transcriptional regulator
MKSKISITVDEDALHEVDAILSEKMINRSIWINKQMLRGLAELRSE